MLNKAILAFDAGGTSFKYALLSYESLEFIGKEEFYPVPSFGTTDEMLGLFRRVFTDAIAQSRALSLDISDIAFSVPGPFDCKRGVSLMKHKWPAVKDIPLVDVFRKFGVFADNVRFSFLHDVHSFLLGEKYFGKAAECRKAAGIVIGTGVGFGMWDGENFITDETGHPRYGIYKSPYRGGILEDFVSGRGIVAAYERLTGKSSSAKAIEDEARKGNPDAIKIYSDMGCMLGEVVFPILEEYGIEAVVFGGRLSLAFDLFVDSFSYEVRAKSRGMIVYPSEMLEHAAMKGAAIWSKRFL